MQRAESEFKPLVQRYRTVSKLSNYFFATFALSVVAGLVFGNSAKSFMNLVFWIGALAWLFGCGCLLTNAFLLYCPSCDNGVFSIGAFCPECGTHGVTEETFFKAAWCAHCQKDIHLGSKGVTRSFILKFCTSCGVLLDSGGIMPNE